MDVTVVKNMPLRLLFLQGMADYKKMVAGIVVADQRPFCSMKNVLGMLFEFEAGDAKDLELKVNMLTILAEDNFGAWDIISLMMKYMVVNRSNVAGDISSDQCEAEKAGLKKEARLLVEKRTYAAEYAKKCGASWQEKERLCLVTSPAN